MRGLPVVLGCVAALVFGAAGAQAQAREGFYIGGGAGRGWADLTGPKACQTCHPFDSGWTGAFAAHVRLGASLNSHVGLGVELKGWFHDDTSLFDTFSNASLAVSVHPGDSGFFVTAGPGLARTSLRTGQDTTVSHVGLGFVGGLGYDVHIGRTAALTPIAAYWWGDAGDLGNRYSVLELSVGFTLY